MSDFTSSVETDSFPTKRRRRSFVEKITALMAPPRFSKWYVNETGNFAVRAHVICGRDRLFRAVLTIRRGCYKAEYIYSQVQIVLPCDRSERRKAFRLACRQAEHLARLRYRFLSGSEANV